MNPRTPLPTRHIELLSGTLAGLMLWAALYLNLLPALLAGLLVYEIINTATPPLARWLTRDRERARWLMVLVLAVVVVGLLIALGFGIVFLLRHELGNPQDLWHQQLMPMLERARNQLPQWIVDHLPDSVESLRVSAMHWLRDHAKELQLAGREAARVLVQILIGLVLGAIVAMSHVRPASQSGPLTAALRKRVSRLAGAFHQVVFAQIRISLINTAFTAIFLLGVLPLLGVHLPLSKTLVLATFIFGLLPVIGNLISNTAIVIVALSVSWGIALAALAFLIAIHKLEYFLNARIVGTRIHSRAWELLVAMLVMEAAFGLPGLIAAPIYYAYLKRELRSAGLI